MKEKLTSKVVWLTAIPLIAGIISLYLPGVGEQFTNIAMPIVTLLALFGILNNPNDKENF